MSSPTVPTAGQSESDVLDVRAEIWRKRPLLREIYQRYFSEMVRHLATGRGAADSFGTILEIGGGSGNFKQYFLEHGVGRGRLIASDIVPTVHCDLAADAMALPFPEETLDNILMMDVLHHIPYPLRFFAEAQRTLRPGGRIVMTEPYISPASRLVFKLAHPEPVDPSARIFSEEPGGGDPCPLRGEGAFASNQATPTLLFYRDLRKFQGRFPRLRLVLRARRSMVLYPLSGGFSGPKVMPHCLAPIFWPLEKILSPLSPLLAFRLVVVLEKV